MKLLLSMLVVAGLVASGVYVFTNLQFTAIADFREAVLGSSPAEPLEYGRTLFRTRGCAGCHEANDVGAAAVLGPNLSAIARRADGPYLRRALIRPDEVIAGLCNNAACPAGVMPAYGEILNVQQINALVDYMLTLNGE